MSPPFARISQLAVVAFAGALVATPPAFAEPPAIHRIEPPSSTEVEKDLPVGKELSGHDIYDRFLRNRKRLRSVVQTGRIVSKDPYGNPQETRFVLKARDYRDANDDPSDGIYSKTVIRFTGPREIERTAYLYIHRSDRTDDQFLYSPIRQRTARTSLRGQNVAGTDFSFDDLLAGLNDVEDATYRRLPDETLDGVSCYVIEALMKPGARSSYTRSVSVIEKEHYVPLRTRYWDEFGVAAKEMRTPHASIKNYDGSWLPTETTMTDLLEETQSKLNVDTLEANPTLDDGEFSTAALERS